MEKINALIEKLQELKNSGADLQAISYYVQLLQAEVLHMRNKQHQQAAQERQQHVAVIMPMQQPVMNAPVTTAAQTTTLPADKPEVPAAGYPQSAVVADPAPSQPELVIIARPAPPPVASKPEPQEIPAPVREPLLEPFFKESPAPEKKPVPATLFDQVDTITAVKNSYEPDTHALRKDLNELVGNNSGTSLNDRFRQQQPEVAQKLGEMPVKDLRSAIGINDKYQFIQELFRGDTDLYERSVKTINECSTLQEADYWIQREIKIIQGWQDDHHLVKHFYSLLRKRFS
ncbi:hypothetical protein [Chitinophaga sp. HK235]|uniref:hypothetical protein n=1 Tax=Chitinophaga sp. HK235 TaxID=2952571 RepID=UPI001BA80AA2|nr:hypothetical protein [Chitinophaga sp. HK235]